MTLGPPGTKFKIFFEIVNERYRRVGIVVVTRSIKGQILLNDAIFMGHDIIHF